MARARKSTGSGTRQTRNSYPPAFREEAVRLADLKGAVRAAAELNIAPADIYRWRTKLEAARSQSETEKRLLAENARLKRELAEREEELVILGKASVYFAKKLK